MAKAPKKKSAPRKKRVAETDYEVTVKDNTPGADMPSKTATVSARDAETAMSTATDGNSNDAEEVTVKKKSAMGSRESSGGSGGVHSMESISASVTYPYSISLPSPFRRVIAESTTPFTKLGNTIMITYPNKTKMIESLRSLKKADPVKANLIIEGIHRSLS